MGATQGACQPRACQHPRLCFGLRRGRSAGHVKRPLFVAASPSKFASCGAHSTSVDPAGRNPPHDARIMWCTGTKIVSNQSLARFKSSCEQRVRRRMGPPQEARIVWGLSRPRVLTKPRAEETRLIARKAISKTICWARAVRRRLSEVCTRTRSPVSAIHRFEPPPPATRKKSKSRVPAKLQRSSK